MEHTLTSRAQARLAKLSRYYTGKACKNGHVSARYVSTRGCVDCLKSRIEIWREQNQDHVKEYSREYYWADPEKRNAATRTWFKNNPLKAAALRKSWHAKNPKARVLHENSRRARKKESVGYVTKQQIFILHEKQRKRCPYCLKSIAKKYEIDHIQPLAKRGSNDIGNIQLLCPDCNRRKHAKDPVKFANQIGLLI